ncbi:hypothetical protein LUZ60_015081 [Juncus effusus]|nr:hypothetical protein LUZ60_015081 [Juncus effusus]
MGRSKLTVLKSLEETKFKRRHFLVLVSSFLGFLSATYSLVSINFVARLIGRIYYSNHLSPFPGALPPNVQSAIVAVALCGTFLGQLFFGWLGDKLGRNCTYGFTLIIIIIFSIASAFSFGPTAKEVLATLCFFRFWLGFGVGGVYPLTATIVAEYAKTRWRGLFLAIVVVFQGVGTIFAGTISIIVSTSFNNKYKAPSYKVNHVGSTVHQADHVWRIILIFSALPALVAFFLRKNFPESPRYTALVLKNPKKAAYEMSQFINLEITEEIPEETNQIQTGDDWGLFSRQFVNRHGLHLFATCSVWFFFSLALYSQTIIQKDIFMRVGWLPRPDNMNAIEEVFRIIRAQIFLALCGTMPGLWLTIGLVEVLGRKTIQLIGFFFMTIFMLGLAIPYNHWISSNNHAGFVAMYGVTYFFANFGPNPTTFIIPAEIFPARMRATCHGISAASGRLGVIVGLFGFLYASQGKTPEPGYNSGIGVRKSLFLLVVANFLGFVMTFFLPETKGKSLEELAQEDCDEEIELTRDV